MAKLSPKIINNKSKKKLTIGALVCNLITNKSNTIKNDKIIALVNFADSSAKSPKPIANNAAFILSVLFSYKFHYLNIFFLSTRIFQFLFLYP